MSYGIEITGNDSSGNFLVTDSDLNLVNFVIYSAGNANQVYIGNTPIYKIFVNARGVSGASSTGLSGGVHAAVDNGYVKFYTCEVEWSGDMDEAGYSISITQTAMPYFLITRTSAASIPSGETYGAQIFTSTGEVAFDSRRVTLNESFFVSSSFAGSTASNATITSENKYVSINTFLYSDGVSENGRRVVAFPPSTSSGSVFYKSNIWGWSVDEGGFSWTGRSGGSPAALIADLR